MIGTSAFDFYFIRACILGLHYVAPICILYVVFVVGLYGLRATRYPVPLVIESVAFAETLFFLLCYLPYRSYLQKKATHPPAPEKAKRQELFALCNRNISDQEAYLRKWFLGAELEDIKRENVKEFLLWAFFNRGGPPGDDEEELEEYVQATEELLGRRIEPGWGTAKSLRTTIDEVHMMHRSLIWYCCVGFVDFLTYLAMLFKGFHHHRTPLSQFFTLFPFRPISLFTRYRSPVKHTMYWHRPHTSKTKLPVLFIHGIGIGLYPYVNFLAELNSSIGLEDGGPDDQVGIIALELMPVSFRITHPALTKDVLCKEVAAILAYHGYDKVVLVSHSYGTVVSTHLLQHPATRDLVGPVVLIDPVSILLHLPDVAYNFTRRQPYHANEHQLYYFASMDMAVSSTLSRHFFWSQNIVWKKDLRGRNVTISLAGRDLIVPTGAVGRYLASTTPDEPEQDPSHTKLASSVVLVDLDAPEEGEGGRDDFSNGKVANGSAYEIEDAADLEDADAWKHRVWKGKGTDVIWFEGLDHAQVFDKPATRRPLLNAIKTYCAEGSLSSTDDAELER